MIHTATVPPVHIPSLNIKVSNFSVSNFPGDNVTHAYQMRPAGTITAIVDDKYLNKCFLLRKHVSSPNKIDRSSKYSSIGETIAKT